MSVVVPIAGDPPAPAACFEALARLELGADDELILADNSIAGTIGDAGRSRLVHAADRRSAYHARNAGAAAASTPWLLFIDADCEPPPDLVDRLLTPAPADGCAIVAGEARGRDDQARPLARWARSRRGLIAAHGIRGAVRPTGTSANLLVRRCAFVQVGGFHEVRSDADADLCWRIQAAGSALEYRPQAIVLHRDPDRLRPMLRQAFAYGAGRRWLRRTHGPEVEVPALLGPLARGLAGTVVWTLRGDRERALFQLLDGAYAGALWWGYRAGDNRAELR